MQILALFSATLLIVLSLTVPQLKMRAQTVRKAQNPHRHKNR